MNSIEKLYYDKGQAHTQVEIWQQVLKQANVALSKELGNNPGGLNAQVKENTGTPENSKDKSN